MPYAVPSSTGGTGTSPIAPLTAASTHSWAPQADAQLALSGRDDHGQRLGGSQQLTPQALLVRLHRAVLVAAVDLCLELLRAKVVCQCPGDFLCRDGGAIEIRSKFSAPVPLPWLSASSSLSHR
jgi:monoamine oxidase